MHKYLLHNAEVNTRIVQLAYVATHITEAFSCLFFRFCKWRPSFVPSEVV